MKDLNELRRRRGAIINDMRALTDTADAEKRELTAEENDQYSRMEADQEKLRIEIEREEMSKGNGMLYSMPSVAAMKRSTRWERPGSRQSSRPGHGLTGYKRWKTRCRACSSNWVDRPVHN